MTKPSDIFPFLWVDCMCDNTLAKRQQNYLVSLLGYLLMKITGIQLWQPIKVLFIDKKYFVIVCSPSRYSDIPQLYPLSWICSSNYIGINWIKNSSMKSWFPTCDTTLRTWSEWFGNHMVLRWLWILCWLILKWELMHLHKSTIVKFGKREEVCA